MNNLNAPVDSEQISLQLSALGWQEGASVFLRSFFSSKDLRKDNDSGRKEIAKSLKQIVTTAQDWQAEGRGVYFVVNFGGHTDREVTECRAIFYEHDDLPKEKQVGLWKSLGLPEPSLQVDTGGKSIHNYWILTELIPQEKWKALQRDLLEFSQGDRQLKNPSRVMRLAGCWHLGHDGKQLIKNGQSIIRLNSGKRYSFEELRQIIPPSVQKLTAADSSVQPISSNPQPSISSSIPPIPLENCLCKQSRERLKGVKEGDRNDAGAALARDLIGTAACLEAEDIAFVGNPHDLFQKFGANCSPPLESGELKFIWQSAQKANPEPSCTKEGVKNIVENWNCKHSDRRWQLSDRIAEILRRNLPLKTEKEALIELRQSTRTNDREFNDLVNTVREELSAEISRENTADELKEILEAKYARCDLSKIFPEKLIEAVLRLSEMLNLRPESYALILLCTVASLHKPGTSLVLYPGSNFKVNPNLYGAIVAPSSQKKSPIIREIASEPLKPLRKEAREAHQLLVDQYEREMELYSKKENSCRKPSPPPKRYRVYYYTKATSEALIAYFNERKTEGLLANIDELDGLFSSANQYRGGRGSDLQDLLSYYDGTGEQVLRKSGIDADFDELILSIIGGIQPEVLRDRLKDCKDAAGQWARFMFVEQPLAPAFLKEGMGKIDLTPMLVETYRKIDSLPATEYQLSREAAKLFIKVHNQLEQKRCNETAVGMAQMWGKSVARIGKVALNLHILEAAFNQETPNLEVSLTTLEAAIAWVSYTANVVRGIFAESDGESLAPHLQKILEIAKRLDRPITVRDLSRARMTIGGKRITAKDTVPLFLELEKLGYGSLEKTARSVAFTVNDGNVGVNVGNDSNDGNVGANVGNVADVENSLPTRDFDLNDGNDGNDGKEFGEFPELYYLIKEDRKKLRK